MASSKPIPCGPCHEGQLNTKAEFWCYNCDEGLCSVCSGHHKRSKSSRDHKTIDIKRYKPSIQAINTVCDKHGQQFNLYCPSHLIPCCDECIPTSHSKCTEITSLSSVVEQTKMEKSKESLYKDINSILRILNRIITNISGNIKSGEQQRDSIKSMIEEYRKKIDKHLDKLQKKLCQETDTMLNKETSNASDLINEIEEEKEKLDGMKEYLQTVTTYRSKLQAFLGVHQIEQQVHQCQRYVDDLDEDDRWKEFDIKMEQNDEIEKTINKLKSLESLGEVTVVKTEIPMNREIGMKREAQVETREKTNLHNMNIKIGTNININIGNWIVDTICLMDGRILTAKHLLSFDGTLKKHFAISGKAWNVTEINRETIAITYPKEMAIKIFNMENETVTKVIKLDKTCKGLSFSNNSLAVGLDTAEVRIIDVEGNTLKSIQVKSKSPLDHLIYCNGRVIYSDWRGKAVCCVAGSGEHIWQYTHDLSEPRGHCIDTYGNIIVADRATNRMIAISKDGQSSKVLISGKKGGLEFPECICFSKDSESSGFIGGYLGRYLIEFSLSYE
ncbi:uncharacterized protein [Mytilus edulis]|uniref:uncharacterized protein n=1 Tax=Mytilus edulis TaxID=6550 RepID=UPI0039F109BB